MIMLFKAGSIRVMCKYVQLKANTYYYRRRVPKYARSMYAHLGGGAQDQLFFSLKTGDKVEACRRADSHTRRLDALWLACKEGQGVDADPQVSVAVLEAAGLKPGDGVRHRGHFAIDDFLSAFLPGYEPDEPRPILSAQDQLTLDILNGAPIPRTLSDAKEKHFELGKGPKGKVAEQQFDRAWKLLLEITGDITLDHLRRDHANEFVRRLIAQGVGAETVKRYLSQVRPVIKTGILEFELKINNPFEGLTIPNRDDGPRMPRDTYSMAELDAIQTKCRETNDQRRWAIAMLSDTGARLAEIVGIRKEDVFLDAPVPYIRIRATEDRSVKNPQSERSVPLVGEALAAARWASLFTVSGFRPP